MHLGELPSMAPEALHQSTPNNFKEIWGTWDKVLEALDAVNEKTSLKVGEEPVKLASQLRANRPGALRAQSGVSPEKRPLRPPSAQVIDKTAMYRDLCGADLMARRPTIADQLRALQAKEAARDLTLGPFRAWHQVLCAAKLEAAEQRGQAVQHTSGKSDDALRDELKALRSALGDTESRHKAAEATFAARLKDADTLHKEELHALRQELQATKSELSQAHMELAGSRRALGATEDASLASAAQQEAASLRAELAVVSVRKEVMEMSTRLARTEAEAAEARTDARRNQALVDSLRAAFCHGCTQLELAYSMLANSLDAGGAEVALQQLHQLLQHFREPLLQGAGSMSNVKSLPSLTASLDRPPTPGSGGQRRILSSSSSWRDQKRRQATAWPA